MRNQGNQQWDINTADLPPFIRRLSSIRWHLLHYITDSTFPSKQRDLCWGSFRNLRTICRPQDRSFFARHGRKSLSFVTTAALCSTSHTLSSAGGRRSRPKRSWAAPQFSPQQSLNRFPLWFLSLHRGSPNRSASMQPAPQASISRC